MRSLVLGCSVLLAATSFSVAHAQSFRTAPCTDHNSSDSGWFFGHAERACELRDTILPATGHLSVNGKNGGIQVIGEDRRDIALEVKVTAQGSSREEANNLLHQVKIVTNGDIHAEGPSVEGWSHRSWSVDFKLHVPRQVMQADLHTSNGGISIADLQGSVNATSSNGGIDVSHIRGDVRAVSTNGGLNLQDLAGAVHAETTNGGVQISLVGDRWQGSGLFAKSTNGAITVKAGERFAAHLVADTTNGGISVGFPISVQGKLGRHLDTELNGGGATVQLETTNGGVTLDRL